MPPSRHQDDRHRRGLATLEVDGGGFGWFTVTSAPTLDALLGGAVAQAVLHGLQRGLVARRAVTRLVR